METDIHKEMSIVNCNTMGKYKDVCHYLKYSKDNQLLTATLITAIMYSGVYNISRMNYLPQHNYDAICKNDEISPLTLDTLLT